MHFVHLLEKAETERERERERERESFLYYTIAEVSFSNATVFLEFLNVCIAFLSGFLSGFRSLCVCVLSSLLFRELATIEAKRRKSDAQSTHVFYLLQGGGERREGRGGKGRGQGD